MRLVSMVALLCLTGAASAENPPAPLSPACALLTVAEVEQVLGHAADAQDGGPETGGIATCSWVETDNFNALGVIVNEGEAFAGVKAADAFDAAKSGQAMLGTQEALQGVGDDAFLVTSGAGDAASLMIGMLKGDRIIDLNGSGLKKEQMIAAAKLVAGHL